MNAKLLACGNKVFLIVPLLWGCELQHFYFCFGNLIIQASTEYLLSEKKLLYIPMLKSLFLFSETSKTIVWRNFVKK